MAFEMLLKDDNIPQQKNRIVRVVNLLSISTAITVLILGPYLYFITGYYEILYPSLIEGTLFLLVPILNKRGKNLAALRLMFAVHTIAIAYYTLILGPSSNVLAFAGFLCVATFTIFEKRISQLVAMAMIIVLTAGVKASYHYEWVPILPLSPSALYNLDWTVFISVIVLIASILYCHDNEKKRNEKEKEILMQKLDLANRSKSDYVRKTAHELRAPMSVIYGLVQDYEPRRNDNSKGINISYKDFEDLNIACQNLLQVINNTLVWSRIEAGKQEEVSNIPFAIKQWMNHEVQAYKRLARDKRVELVVDAGNLPDEIIIDRAKLMRVLINLLTNAIKFTKNNTTVTFKGYVSGGKMIFQVTDEGNGIGGGMQEKIFIPFISEGQQNTESTGLGLPIAKQMTRILGGDLTLKSVVGVGTTFTVTLPLEVSNRQPVMAVRTKELHEDEIRGRKILVVDDDTIQLEITRRFIVRFGAVPILVDSALLAIDYLSTNAPPDLILLDLNMRNMSGMDFMEKVHLSPVWSNIPVIVLSGDAFSEVQERVIGYGASAYVTKPIVFGQLKALINSILVREDTIPA